MILQMIINRNSGQVDFTGKTMLDYAGGFGDPRTEFWMGEKVYFTFQTKHMNSFNKTEAAVFSFRPCFLRASLSSV